MSEQPTEPVVEHERAQEPPPLEGEVDRWQEVPFWRMVNAKGELWWAWHDHDSADWSVSLYNTDEARRRLAARCADLQARADAAEDECRRRDVDQQRLEQGFVSMAAGQVISISKAAYLVGCTVRDMRQKLVKYAADNPRVVAAGEAWWRENEALQARLDAANALLGRYADSWTQRLPSEELVSARRSLCDDVFAHLGRDMIQELGRAALTAKEPR